MNHANWVLGIGLLVGVGTTGCGSRTYAATRTNTADTVSKAPDCDFAILTETEPDHEEVAILESEGQPAMTAAEFQRIVGRQVCELGGDAVVAEIDDQGAYLRGKVLRRKDAPEATAANEPASEASVPSPPPSQ